MTDRVQFITSLSLPPVYCVFNVDLLMLLYDLGIEYKDIILNPDSSINIKVDNSEFEYLYSLLNNKIVNKYSHLYNISLSTIDHETLNMKALFLGVSG